MEIRAAVLHHITPQQPFVDSRPLIIEQLTLDAPGPGEVLIQMCAAGLCHSN